MPETATDTDYNFDAAPELFADMTKTDIVHVLEYLHFPKNAQRPDQNRQAGARLLDQPAFRATLIRSFGRFARAGEPRRPHASSASCHERTTGDESAQFLGDITRRLAVGCDTRGVGTGF